MAPIVADEMQRNSNKLALLREIESHRLEVANEPALEALRREIEEGERPQAGTESIITSFDSDEDESEEESDEEEGNEAIDSSWPEWLVDELYQVIKINNVRDNLHNRRQRRLVALRRNGFSHLKPRGKTSILRKFHPYRDIAATYLLSANRICISFFNDVNYVYETPLAAQIGQQIAARREASRSLYTHYNISLSIEPRAQTKNKSPKTPIFRRLSSSSTIKLSPTRSSDSMPKDEAGNEHRLRISLTKFIMDGGEGRAIVAFVTQQQKNKKFNFLSSKSRKTWAEAGATIRAFLDGLFDYIWSNRESELWHIFNTAHTSSLGNTSTNKSEALENALAEILEECVLSPLLPPLNKALNDPVAESLLYKNRQRLRSATPLDLGVTPSLADCRWTRAIFSLSTLDDKALPLHKLATLTATAKEIHDEHKKLLDAFTHVASLKYCQQAEKDFYMTKKKPPSFLAADDFLPIFIYVFVQAELHSPLQARTLLWALANPKHLRGESGYFLTMFDAAIEYVQSGAAWSDAVEQNPDLVLDDADYTVVHNRDEENHRPSGRLRTVSSSSTSTSGRNSHHPRPPSHDRISL